MIRLFYKLAQTLETPSADDSVPGDLPTSPSHINFMLSTKKLPVDETYRNLMSWSKNVPVIERGGSTGDVFMG